MVQSGVNMVVRNCLRVDSMLTLFFVWPSAGRHCYS